MKPIVRSSACMYHKKDANKQINLMQCIILVVVYEV